MTEKCMKYYSYMTANKNQYKTLILFVLMFFYLKYKSNKLRF